MHLLTMNQTKMLKSLSFGYRSAALNLPPAWRYKWLTTCPKCTDCSKSCLKDTGRNSMPMAYDARERRGKMLVDDTKLFLTLLHADLASHSHLCSRDNLLPTARLNCLSDIDWLDIDYSLFLKNPGIQFIDYTKVYTRLFRVNPTNYHLTYSFNEKTPKGLIEKIFQTTRYNVAVALPSDHPAIRQVLHTGKGTATLLGVEYPTILGDESDLRHLDPRGHLVLLEWKKSLKKDKTPLEKNRFYNIGANSLQVLQ